MPGPFGRADRIINGALFGLYHLHQTWPIPQSVLAGVFLLAYPARRFHSAWMGVIVHTTQSIAFAAIALAIVSS